VLGLSLAERAQCSCANAGIRRFLIVLGHQAKEVEAHFGDIGRRRGFEVNFCEAEGWRRGNGASALAAVGRVGEGPFFLIMADHLVDPEIYRLMLEDPPRAGEVCLAVDRAGGNLFDAGEATKVRIEEDRVCAIGKGLSDWDGVDTGVFFCNGEIFKSLALARGRGCHALSDAGDIGSMWTPPRRCARGAAG
jgi:choline kinase